MLVQSKKPPRMLPSLTRNSPPCHRCQSRPWPKSKVGPTDRTLTMTEHSGLPEDSRGPLRRLLFKLLGCLGGVLCPLPAAGE